MKPLEPLKEKGKVLVGSRIVPIILLSELFLNASLYFALKSNHEPVSILLVGLIVLGYLGLVWLP